MIRKRTINLVIRQEQIPTPFSRLNRIMPRIAAGILALFLLIYGVTFLYLQINIGQFERMKQDIARLEQTIASKKAAEGVYTLAFQEISVIERLMKEKKNYPRLVTDILQLQTNDVSFSSLAVANDNTIALSVSANSSAALESFVSGLVHLEKNASYTHIIAQGILRDRYGKYTMTLSMIPNPSLLQ